MKSKANCAALRGWIPDRIEFVPCVVKDELYQMALAELAEIIYSTYELPVQDKPDSTMTGSNPKPSLNEAFERIKSA